MRLPMAPRPTKPSVVTSGVAGACRARAAPRARDGVTAMAARARRARGGAASATAIAEISTLQFAMRREPRHLHGGRRRQVIAQVGRPYPVEIVLLAGIGEVARGGDEVAEPAARRFERLHEVVHREHGLLAHGRGQVELLLPVRMAVVDRRGRHARQEDQCAAAHQERGRVRHRHVAPPVGVMHGHDVLLRHGSIRSRVGSAVNSAPLAHVEACRGVRCGGPDLLVSVGRRSVNRRAHCAMTSGESETCGDGT